MSARFDIGAVIPVYNSERSVETVAHGILEVAQRTGLSCRVVLVDDQSPDKSGRVIDRIACADARVTAVHLAKRSGQQAALLCGLTLAADDCRFLLTMDDDLQHPSQVVKTLYERIQEGFDLVYAIPDREKRPFFRRAGSLMRDALFTLCTNKPRGVRVSSFRMMTAELTQKICAERQNFVYLSASAFRYAPKTSNVFYAGQVRAYGTSGYTLRRLTSLYTKLFVYYTAPGALFRSRARKTPYQIESIVEGGIRFEQTDDSRRFQLPDQCVESCAFAWTSNGAD